MKDHQKSTLWQLTLRARGDDPFAAQRNRLCAAYDIFWDRGVELAKRISLDVPGLTLHDEAHLSALWARASQLTGSEYPINPLEAFVLGGAILLHDAGHAVVAYCGGISELEQTLEYRDATAATLGRNEAVPAREQDLSAPPKHVADEAMFMALRRLHSKQAQVLATRSFSGVYLIDDQELRQNLGQLIGRVAASHHWDRNSLEERLPKLQGAPGFMPEEWCIEPVKIACLLRCADAIQIDQRRAPAFALAIHDPQGHSRLHWMAQQIAQPVVKPDTGGGPGALVFTSQNDFVEDDADAWWIAHDLLNIANEELKGCYSLMKDLALPAFLVDRVAGAEGATQLTRFVRTAGWRPINAQVRVSSVDQIVRLFGGRYLYGNDPVVPLRELIQNASDAVRARRKLTTGPRYDGMVVVRLSQIDGGTWRLRVEDDGIGMSERALTGPLLEFGKSFWGSEEAQDEFPGLVSARLDQGGRFGIGFFSTLMITKRIEVTSRRWDAGLDQTRKLTLKDGLKSRPLVSTVVPESLGQLSTRVEIRISSDTVDGLVSVLRHPKGDTKANLKQVVAHLCPILDCDVWVVEGSAQMELAHSQRWAEADALEWAGQISYADLQGDSKIQDHLAKQAPYIKVIKNEQGEPCGRAAIAFGQIPVGISAIGRFASETRSIYQFSFNYVGSIGYDPDGPRRGHGSILNKEGVKAWASEQAVLLASANLNEAEQCLAAMNVAEFGGNPAPVAKILVSRNWMSLGQVYDLLVEGNDIFVALERSDSTSIGSIVYWPNPHQGISIKSHELDLGVLVMEAWRPGMRHQIYVRIPTDDDPVPSCFLTCLAHYAESKGHPLKMERATDVRFGSFNGMESPRDGLFKGTEIRGDAIRLTVAR